MLEKNLCGGGDIEPIGCAWLPVLEYHVYVANVDEDQDLEAFAKRARRALNELDPPPADVSTIANLAYELRDLPTIDVADDDERQLAGVRAERDLPSRASHDGVSLTWVYDDGVLHGIVTPRGHRIDLQLLDGSSSELSIDEADGSFRVDSPDTPCRFVVHASGGAWATPWLA